MSHRTRQGLVVVTIVIALLTGVAPSVRAQATKSLFADPSVGKFFVGMSADTRASFKQKNKNLVCNVTGGPCQVISRTAKTAHAGLGITGADFEVVANHLVAVLNSFKVPAQEQKELIAIITTLRPDIVEK